MIRALIAMGVVVVLGGAAQGHDAWRDGSPIPEWVKSQCCGPADAHMLSAEDVSEEADGWHIRGLNKAVAQERVFPSQDKYYWAFYPRTGDPNAMVFCLFIPMTM